MPSSGRGTGRRRQNDWAALTSTQAERGAEVNELELGWRVAWCIELERLMIEASKDLYRLERR